VLSKYQLIPGINLNFSSLSVVYVILFTIAIVLLSTLHPAHVATRTAIPSGKRKWSLPDTDGQTMQVSFPFIYQEALLPGIMHYIEVYLSKYTEASLGDLIATPTVKQSGADEAGRPTYALGYHIALAPYDLGVTQDVIFRGGYDERVESYRVVMEIRRVSGQDTNWVATNKPFLEKLRQYMLHWRNLGRAQHADFIERGLESFRKESVG
jgi:hypothetical protein